MRTNDPISLFATLAGVIGLIAGYGFRSASLRPPKAQAMDNFVPLHPETASSLAMALIVSSQAPVLLLDDELTVLGASSSFCRSFHFSPGDVTGIRLSALGTGEWNVRQLDSLLRATITGDTAIPEYEMDLVRPGHAPCRLVLNAQRLDYLNADVIRIVLTVTDVTATRLAEKLKEDLVRDKHILMQELQHRVANSLQIIASVLMQSARKVQSEESRFHLQEAHHRVMSIATLQRQLAASSVDDVALKPYFSDLCRSIGASMISDHDRLSIETTVDDSTVSADISVSLGLIVTELVINALKHAFPHDRSGKINVNYVSQGPAWSLAVADNGIGMATGRGDAKPGLGTGIIDALSRQLAADITITDARPGTRVLIAHE